MLNRIDATTSLVEGARVPTRLFANAEVSVDAASLREIIEFSTLADTIEKLRGVDFFGDVEPGFDRIVLTPDFHTASPTAWPDQERQDQDHERDE
jgi:hypothetical protein